MSRRATVIALSPEEERTLQQRVHGRRVEAGVAQRARIVLAAGAGEKNEAIAQREGVDRRTVGLWRQRFAQQRLAGLEDRPRTGRPRMYGDAHRLRVVETVCSQEPEAESHWSVRTLASATGVGRGTVHRLLRRLDLKPHRLATFSRSPDPEFAAKVIDVVGLYLRPPEHAVVLCVDEKTQVQALERTQPMLPLRPHQIARRTHDYKRHGTVQLYAALEVAAGKVTALTTQRHRSQEFIAFLNRLLREYPGQELHVILDNVSTHRSAKVAVWHAMPEHQRVRFHPIPTYSSWLNLVEVFFSLLQRRVLSRGVFSSTRVLVERILAYIAQFNQQGKRFHWTKTAEAILSTPTNVTGY